MIGRVLGNRYEIIEKIGEGGMSIVYKAKCRLLNRFVAIKVLRSEFVKDEEFVKRFEKESQAAASLSHNNVVGIYDVGYEEDIHYIVMELMNCQTLKEFIQCKTTFLSNEEIIAITLQIASALDHAHNTGIIHRDIKPHNILITEEGLVKVADFGIARAVTSSTMVNTAEVVGSVHYASPEQARGGFLDAKSDLYSLGVVMYELATGRVPFEADTPISVALKHLKEEVVPPSLVNMKLKPSLEAVILKCLVKDAAFRYTSAKELSKDLEKIQHNPDVEIAYERESLDSPTTKLPSMKDYKEDESLKPSRRITKQKQSYVGVGLTIFAALAFSFLILFVMFFKPLMASQKNLPFEMPDVVGENYTESNVMLSQKGLFVEITEQVNSTEYAANTIITQSPAAGDKVKPGQKVRVVISIGAKKATVPILLNKSLKDAELIAKNNKMKIGDITEQFSDLPVGLILSQKPAGGLPAQENTVIDVIVSKGPENKVVLVPSLVGKTMEEAKTILEGLNLQLNPIGSEYSDTVFLNSIARQELAPGKEVSEGVLINVFVSKGPENVEVPTDEAIPTEVEKMIPITLPTDIDVVMVKATLMIDTIELVVYEQEHKKEEVKITVPVKGSGEMVVNIYFDGQFIESKKVNFE
jgi:serine/threonine-protein kinase